jgi:L-iditol 2-dehydrogenase
VDGMAVARLHAVADLRIATEPVPVAGAGEELIRVTAVGLCGSDLHWYADGGIGDARLDRPLVIGHEFAGVIAGGLRDGTRVAVDPAMPCAACDTCRSGHGNLCPEVRFAGHGTVDGALREYLTWPADLLQPLPAGLTDADGAMLEPLGVALHAYDLGHARVGARVAVIGCGPIGLLLIQIARLAGAAAVLAVEPRAHRRTAAERFGADAVATPDEATPDWWRTTAGAGVDVAIEIAGTDTAVDLALHAARPGGRVVLAGIPDADRTSFPASLARRKGLTLALSRRMHNAYPRAIGLVAAGRIDVRSVVTARYPLGRADEAMAAAVQRTGLKVLVEP